MTFRPIDRRSLPPQVLARWQAQPLADFADDLFADSRDRRASGPHDMVRAELRAADDDSAPHLVGYAAVWDVWYDVAGGPPWGWRERVSADAVTRSLAERDDIRALVNHDGVPIARTKPKTLTVVADKVGMLTDAPALDRANPTVAELVSAMTRGDIDEMSWAFTVLDQQWNGDFTERTILEARIFDVSVVTYPANPATIAQLRSTLELLAPASPPAGMPLGLASALADASRLRRAG